MSSSLASPKIFKHKLVGQRYELPEGIWELMAVYPNMERGFCVIRLKDPQKSCREDDNQAERLWMTEQDFKAIARI